MFSAVVTGWVRFLQDLVVNVQIAEDTNEVSFSICQRVQQDAPRPFVSAQRYMIGHFVNSVVHWLWRGLTEPTGE